MTDTAKAGWTAMVFTGIYVAVGAALVGPTVEKHLDNFVNGPLYLRHGDMSTLMGALVLIAAVFFVFFVPALATWRSIYLRRTGQILQRAHGDVRRGMAGMESLQGRAK